MEEVKELEESIKTMKDFVKRDEKCSANGGRAVLLGDDFDALARVLATAELVVESLKGE